MRLYHSYLLVVVLDSFNYNTINNMVVVAAVIVTVHRYLIPSECQRLSCIELNCKHLQVLHIVEVEVARQKSLALGTGSIQAASSSSVNQP